MRRLPRRSAARCRTAAAGLLLALGAVACARPPKDPVARLLAVLESAVEQRDAEAVVAQLAPDFHGKGGIDRATAAGEMRRYFALYEDVSVERAQAEVTNEGGDTLIVVRVLFSAKPKVEGRLGLRPLDSAPIRFALKCREAEGRLLVVEADWEEESPGQAPQP